jgi:hypothetical protein
MIAPLLPGHFPEEGSLGHPTRIMRSKAIVAARLTGTNGPLLVAKTT